MAVSKVLLYYVFAPLADPEALRLWQRDLCESLGLRGRILISRHGLNGTVGGDLDSVKKYLRKTREYPAFAKISAKWSEGSGFDASTATQQAPWGYSLDFPRLSVKVRDEIVSFGAQEELQVNQHGVVGGGKKLSPQKLHELLKERGGDVKFFDGRNAFEAEIGRFENAIVPEVNNTREFMNEIASGKYDSLKKQPIVTYCTGGIRCEVLSALMINRGFEEVYQLDGGIVRYGETFGDTGLWKGSLYVFDNRMSMTFSEEAEIISHCYRCQAASSHMENCGDLSCRRQLVICEKCSTEAITRCEIHTAVAQRFS